MRYFDEGGAVLWRWWCGTLTRVVRYFEDGVVVFWRWWCATSKMVVWFFEEGDVVQKMVVCYFEDGGVLLWRGCCGFSKMVVWFFEEGDGVLDRFSSGMLSMLKAKYFLSDFWNSSCVTSRMLCCFGFIYISLFPVISLWYIFFTACLQITYEIFNFLFSRSNG